VTVSILAVDDESDVAELYRQRFRREVRQGTYRMHFANSGEDALGKLAGGVERATGSWRPERQACLRQGNGEIFERLHVAAQCIREAHDDLEAAIALQHQAGRASADAT
jgi:hypothetical protein